jgi:UDP-glucose:glycoprotein glucosyltransferase
LIPPARTAVLYASFNSQNFRDLHSHLFYLANTPSPRLEYVLRYVAPKDRDVEDRTYLSGYGVALDLKKMDYLALDDRNQSEIRIMIRRCLLSNRLAGSGDGENDIEHTIDIPLEEELVLTLLQNYPENINTDFASPLTSEELSGESVPLC